MYWSEHPKHLLKGISNSFDLGECDRHEVSGIYISYSALDVKMKDCLMLIGQYTITHRRPTKKRTEDGPGGDPGVWWWEICAFCAYCCHDNGGNSVSGFLFRP